jgi:hypothetical protein
VAYTFVDPDGVRRVETQLADEGERASAYLYRHEGRWWCATVYAELPGWATDWPQVVDAIRESL